MSPNSSSLKHDANRFKSKSVFRPEKPIFCDAVEMNLSDKQSRV